MRYSVYYPNTYSSDKLLAHQHPVPSQNVPMPDAYYPVYPFVNDRPLAGEAVSSTGYTVATFDSRPPSGTDFIFQPVIIITPDLGAVYSEFTVPVGYIAILRSVEVQTFPDKNQATISLTGPVTGLDFGQITVNGLPVQTYDLIDVSMANTGSVIIPCFVAAVEGSTIGFNIPAFGPPGGRLMTLYGNLIPATGRSLPLEYTNANPVPVDVQSGTPGTTTAA